jgi:hypothetical protein
MKINAGKILTVLTAAFTLGTQAAVGADISALSPVYPAEPEPYLDRQTDFLIKHFFGYEYIKPESRTGEVSRDYGITDWFFYLFGDFKGKYVNFNDYKNAEKELEDEIPRSLYPTWFNYNQSFSEKKNNLILPFYGEVCLFEPDADKQKALKPRLYYSFLVKTQELRSGILKLLEKRIAEEERELFTLKQQASQLCGGAVYSPEGTAPQVVDDKGTLLATDRSVSKSACLGGGFPVITDVFSSVTEPVMSAVTEVVDLSPINNVISSLDPTEIVSRTMKEIGVDPSVFQEVINKQLSQLSPDRLKEAALEIIKKKYGDKVDLQYYENLYKRLSPDQLRQVIKEQINDFVKEKQEDLVNLLPGDLKKEVLNGDILKEYLKKKLLEEALKNNPVIQKLKENIKTLFKAYLDFYDRVGSFYEELYDKDLYKMTKCLREDEWYWNWATDYDYYDFYVPTLENYVEQVQKALCELVSVVGKDKAEQLFKAARTYAEYNTYGRVGIGPDGKIKIYNWWETASIGLENLVFDRDTIDKMLDNVVDFYFAREFGLMPDSQDELLNLPQSDFEYAKSVLEEGTGETIKNLYGGFPAYKRDDVLYYKPITSRIQYLGVEYSKEERKEQAQLCTLLITRLENVGQEIRMQKRLLYNLTKKYSQLTKEEKGLLGVKTALGE